MDGPRDDHIKWSESEKNKCHMWDLKKWNQWSYLQNRSRLSEQTQNYGYQRDNGMGEDKLGVWD